MDGIIGIVIIAAVIIIIISGIISSILNPPDFEAKIAKEHEEQKKRDARAGGKERCPLCGATAGYGEVHPDCGCYGWYLEDMQLGILPPGLKELSYGSWLLLRLVDKDLEASKITLKEAKTRTKKIIKNAKTEKTHLNEYRQSQRQHAVQAKAEKRSRYLY